MNFGLNLLGRSYSTNDSFNMAERFQSLGYQLTFAQRAPKRCVCLWNIMTVRRVDAPSVWTNTRTATNDSRRLDGVLSFEFPKYDVRNYLFSIWKLVCFRIGAEFVLKLNFFFKFHAFIQWINELLHFWMKFNLNSSTELNFISNWKIEQICD